MSNKRTFHEWGVKILEWMTTGQKLGYLYPLMQIEHFTGSETRCAILLLIWALSEASAFKPYLEPLGNEFSSAIKEMRDEKFVWSSDMKAAINKLVPGIIPDGNVLLGVEAIPSYALSIRLWWARACSTISLSDFTTL